MATKKKQIVPKPVPMIYVGPSLPNGLLARFTVFNGDYPLHIRELRERSAALRGLFVPVSRLSQAKMDVETQGHILHLYAKNVLKEINK